MITLEGQDKLLPDQKYFSPAGFMITRQDSKYYVDLPSGWTLKDGREVIDERNRKRGYYDERPGQLVLLTYYRLSKCPWMVLDYLGGVVFRPTLFKIINMSAREQYKTQCDNYLETNYPQWENPNAYW